MTLKLIKNSYVVWVAILVLFSLLNNIVILSWLRTIWPINQQAKKPLKYINLEVPPRSAEGTLNTFVKDINKEVKNSLKIEDQNNNETVVKTFIFSYYPKPDRNFTLSFQAPTNKSSIWERNSTLRRNLEKLQTRLTQLHPERCHKMAFVGGWSCGKKGDGMKPVCFDFLELTKNESCLIYSFGSGNEFSFERQMATFGCQTFAFDDDQYHDYPNLLHERLLFFKVRLGVEVTLYDMKYTTGEEDYIFLYRPINNIMYLLNHYDAYIDVLKIDIEGSEWNVFHESLCKIGILRRVGQLILEVHFDVFQDLKKATEEAIISSVDKYNWVFDCLINNGFQLVASLPNELRPIITVIHGLFLKLNYEQLWVNTKYNPPRKLPSRTFNLSTANHYQYLLETEKFH